MIVPLMTCAALLIVVGASLEIVGIGITGWDVWRAHVKTQRRRTHYGSSIGPTNAKTKVRGVGMEGGEPPSVDDRLLDLERAQERAQHRLAEMEAGLAEVRLDLLEHKSVARTEVLSARDDLERHVAEEVAGNVRLRFVGVGLFAAGVIVQTVGNLV